VAEFLREDPGGRVEARTSDVMPAITMLLETVPLYLLFEASVLVSSIVERRERRRATMRPTGEAVHASDS
jgi:Sec-independent protein secretion pathway component TatC